MMLVVGFVPSADELPRIPEDTGPRLVPGLWDIDTDDGGMVRLPLKLVKASADEVLLDEIDEIDPGLGVVGTPPEADSGLVVGTTPLTILLVGKGATLVVLFRGYEPDIEGPFELIGLLLLGPELVSVTEPPEDG